MRVQLMDSIQTIPMNPRIVLEKQSPMVVVMVEHLHTSAILGIAGITRAVMLKVHPILPIKNLWKQLPVGILQK